jgi:hypothetical protein
MFPPPRKVIFPIVFKRIHFYEDSKDIFAETVSSLLIIFLHKKKGQTMSVCPLQKGGNTRKPYNSRFTSIDAFYTYDKQYFKNFLEKVECLS